MKIVPSHTVPGAVPTRRTPVVVPRPGTVKQVFYPNVPIGPDLNPILLYDSVNVKSGGQQPLRSEAFTNNFQRHAEIHTMRCIVQAAELGLLTKQPGLINTGAVISLQISVDGKPLTRGFVPAWMLAPTDNRDNQFSTVTAQQSFYAFDWTFAHPIALRPGGKITVEAKHNGYTEIPMTVHLSFAGKLVKAPSGVSRLPYAFAWGSRQFNYTEVAEETSPPAALANDLDRALRVERIIGRFVSYTSTTAVYGGPSVIAQVTDFDDVTAQGVLWANVRISRPTRPVLRNYTPWRAVFGQNAAIETTFDMEPGDYLTVAVQHLDAVAGGGAAAPTYFKGQGFISVIGWRDA